MALTSSSHTEQRKQAVGSKPEGHGRSTVQAIRCHPHRTSLKRTTQSAKDMCSGKERVGPSKLEQGYQRRQGCKNAWMRTQFHILSDTVPVVQPQMG
ncbi:hypothetical protein Pcinc_024568 [Petrolisthes cinctipes]|uniref:Uncharacterized protein n=1 Tax=Petrolisthes cinctipes TaxID=88211 RepID=A0AAE1FAN5_PETCI|nr:hypothetical protein Pcinc_024568 [Petrolisthes cinctipes]